MSFYDRLFPVGCRYCFHGVFFANLLSGLERLQATGENNHNQRDPATHNGALFSLQFDFSKRDKQMLSLRSQPLSAKFGSRVLVCN
jgi:hypothetical protein